MRSGQVVCQCPNGETLASDGVTCTGKLALTRVVNMSTGYRCIAYLK